MPQKEIKIYIGLRSYAHYGGAWKVAYADFVTAMMAFFLLMWLLNVVTEEQKNALSDYFNPSHPMVSRNQSGSGGVLGGLTMTPEGAMASQKSSIIPPQPTQQRKRGAEEKSKLQQAREKAEIERFKRAAEEIKKKIQETPELAKLSENIVIDMTPEGLRIQIVDREGESMFPSGSAEMFEKTRLLLSQITEVILDMPNELSIRGHTDATRYKKGAKYTNWELSADRANASRRVISNTGMPAERINNVMGRADTEPFIIDNPLDPRNRRITMILLKEDITNPLPPMGENDELIEEELLFDDTPQIPENPFRQTPGKVEFP